MRKEHSIFLGCLILWTFNSEILFAQVPSGLQVHKDIEVRNGDQLEGKLLEILKKFGVGKEEGNKYFKDLRNKFSTSSKDDDDSYVHGLAEEKPEVVSRKLSDGRFVLVISLNPFQGAVNSVFVSVNGKMIFIGTILDNAKYKSFRPMVFECPSRTLVFFSNQTNSGTGIASYDFDIYQISSEKLVPLGSMPLEGFENEWHNYLTIDYKSEFKVVNLGVKNQLQVKVKYKFGIDEFQFTDTGNCITEDTSDKDLFLFNDELIFNYDLQYFPKENDPTKLVFEKNCASATTELENSVFIENHFEKLKNLAKFGKKSQKCWLSELLKDTSVKLMKDQHYRKELLSILGG